MTLPSIGECADGVAGDRFGSPGRAAFLRAVDSVVAGLADDVPGPASGYLRDVVARGGKRIRPRLVFATARCGEPDWELAVRAGVVVEGLHLASLMHDDVIDQADLRRGQPSSPAVLGCEAAVALGTAVSLSCLQMSRELGDDAVGWVADALQILADGELLDCDRAFDTELDMAHYLRILAAKTAALFHLSVRLGAAVAELAPELAGTLCRATTSYGIAFQIIDDCADLVPARQGDGKPAGIDHRRGLYGAPTLLAIGDDTSVAAVLAAGVTTAADIAELRRAVAAAGGFHSAAQMAWDHLQSARELVAPAVPAGAWAEFDALFSLLDVEGVVARAT